MIFYLRGLGVPLGERRYIADEILLFDAHALDGRVARDTTTDLEAIAMRLRDRAAIRRRALKQAGARPDEDAEYNHLRGACFAALNLLGDAGRHPNATWFVRPPISDLHP